MLTNDVSTYLFDTVQACKVKEENSLLLLSPIAPTEAEEEEEEGEKSDERERENSTYRVARTVNLLQLQSTRLRVRVCVFVRVQISVHVKVRVVLRFSRKTAARVGFNQWQWRHGARGVNYT